MDTSAGKICVVRCIHEKDRKAWIQMSKKTHTNPLSKQEIEKLRKNPYVASVTTNTVRFTEAFKEQAYEKKRQGIPVMETMRQCGIDPEILGASRVEGFSSYNIVTVEGTVASRVFFHLKAEAVRMGE